MKRSRTVFICALVFIFPTSGCGGSGHKHSTSSVPLKRIEYDTTCAILTYDSTMKWLFKDAEPTQLSQTELLEIESILDQAIKEHNVVEKKSLERHNKEFPKDQWKQTHYEIAKKGYSRQYVPVINTKGEKEVWINMLCNLRDLKDFDKVICIVHDGGNCYYSLKVNLKNKTYSHLMVNGYA